MAKNKTKKLSKNGLTRAQALATASAIVDAVLARSASKPDAFSDSFTTTEATFSVEVKHPVGRGD